MRTDFKPTEFSHTIICGLYQHQSLHSKINTKGSMLPNLACHATPGIYIHLKDKYSSRRERGEIKQLRRVVEKWKREQ